MYCSTEWWSCLLKPCHAGAAIRDLILVPRCIAQRHLSPDLLTIDKWWIIMQSYGVNHRLPIETEKYESIPRAEMICTK
jgi:hypothetical protein